MKALANSVRASTVCISFVGYFTLVDFPDRSTKKSWTFLSQRECDWVIRRISADRDDADLEKFNWKKWAASGLDLKVWGFALIFCCVTTTVSTSTRKRQQSF